MKSQPLEALQLANEIRYARARIKAEIRSGQINLSDLLREGVPECMASMNAEKLLKTPRYMLRAKVLEYLIDAELSPYQRADRITTRQRNVLADRVEQFEARKRELAEARC